MKKCLALCALVVAFGFAQASAAPYCWDHTERLIVKLKKVDLTTDQLQDVFAYQAEHQKLMRAVHRRGDSCTVHEDAEEMFEKRSIGVLTDEQFEKLQGRERTEAEGLRYENYVLKKEVAALKKQVADMQAKLAKLKKTAGNNG